MSLIAAKREIDGLIRDGIPMEFENLNGKKEQGLVRVIDFNNPAGNRFLAVSQLLIEGSSTIGGRIFFSMSTAFLWSSLN